MEYNNVLCFNEKVYVSCLKQCLEYRKHQMDISWHYYYPIFHLIFITALH